MVDLGPYFPKSRQTGTEEIDEGKLGGGKKETSFQVLTWQAS